MNECVMCLCYGCVHAKDSRVMLWIKFAFVYISLSILSTKRRSWSKEVSLAAFEWCGPGIQTFHLDRWRRVVQ